MDLYDWYYKQVVSPGELSAAFEAADNSLRSMVQTLGIHGLAVGGEVVPTTPTPRLSAVVKGPVLAYDDDGNRILLPDANLAVDLAQDENGASTAIFTPNQERYLAIFVKFTRFLTDPRTDGDGNQIMFARLEGAEVVVAAGAPAPVGAASRAALREGHVLLADVRLTTGMTAVQAGNILTDRTQYLFRATSGELDIWGRTFPEVVQKLVDRFAQFMAAMSQQFLTFGQQSSQTYQAFITNVNGQVASLSQHITSEVNRLAGLIKSAAHEISFQSGASGINADNVQDAIEEVKATIPGAVEVPNLLPANNVWTGRNHFQGLTLFNTPRLFPFMSQEYSHNDEEGNAVFVNVPRHPELGYADTNGNPVDKRQLIPLPFSAAMPENPGTWKFGSGRWSIDTDGPGQALEYGLDCLPAGKLLGFIIAIQIVALGSSGAPSLRLQLKRMPAWGLAVQFPENLGTHREFNEVMGGGEVSLPQSGYYPSYPINLRYWNQTGDTASYYLHIYAANMIAAVGRVTAIMDRPIATSFSS